MTQNRANSTNFFSQFLSTSSTAVFDSTVRMFLDDTIPINTEGTEFLTLAITPKSATSKLLIEFSSVVAVEAASNYMLAALFQDSTVNALAAMAFRQDKICVLRYVMTSGTTSSTTFSIRVGPNATSSHLYTNADNSGVRLLGGVSYSFLTITEYL